MGLNSFSQIYLMKIYIEKINISEKALMDCNCNNTKKNMYLTEFGKAEYYKNLCYLYKLEKSTLESSSNFIKNTTVYFLDEQWKVYNKQHNLPFNHIPIQINYKNYPITEKLSYVLEKENENIIDTYFLTSYTIDNYHLKEELNSFLIKYNNSS
jgi:hypothetical protein